jgi:hypothetical protein
MAVESAACQSVNQMIPWFFEENKVASQSPENPSEVIRTIGQ